MVRRKTVINNGSISKASMFRLIFLTCILVLILSGCNSEGGSESTISSLRTMTKPSGYLHISVSPGDINANIGEKVIISCTLESMINTPVNISSIDLVLFNSSETEIRAVPMNLKDQWSANVTYTIVGDEAFYKLLVDFSINPSEPSYFSEYTADAFSITINQ